MLVFGWFIQKIGNCASCQEEAWPISVFQLLNQVFIPVVTLKQLLRLLVDFRPLDCVLIPALLPYLGNMMDQWCIGELLVENNDWYYHVIARGVTLRVKHGWISKNSSKLQASPREGFSVPLSYSPIYS